MQVWAFSFKNITERGWREVLSVRVRTGEEVQCILRSVWGRESELSDRGRVYKTSGVQSPKLLLVPLPLQAFSMRRLNIRFTNLPLVCVQLKVQLYF